MPLVQKSGSPREGSDTLRTEMAQQMSPQHFVHKFKRPLFQMNVHDESGCVAQVHTDRTQIVHDEERPLLEEARKMFSSVDMDGSDALDDEEVRQLVKRLGFELTDKEHAEAMVAMDADGGGEVDFEEFYAWWIVLRKRFDYTLHAEAVKLFKEVDTDGGGTLSRDEVVELGEKLGLYFHGTELDEAMAAMDEDGSGEVDFHEFYEWWVERKQSPDYEIRAEAVRVFKQVDTDGSGTLTVEEVAEMGKLMDFHFTKSELSRAMGEMDEDGSGEIDFKEFYEWWAARKQRGDQELHNEAARMFEEVDTDGGGTLSQEEVQHLGEKLGFHFSEVELAQAMGEMDEDGSGEVDFQEFYEWYVLRKQRGTLVQVGSLKFQVSVKAQVIATTRRLDEARDSDDPSEMQAALSAAKSVFLLAPAPPDALAIMDEMDAKLQRAHSAPPHTHSR
jgi:calmodulin